MQCLDNDNNKDYGVSWLLLTAFETLKKEYDGLRVASCQLKVQPQSQRPHDNFEVDSQLLKQQDRYAENQSQDQTVMLTELKIQPQWFLYIKVKALTEREWDTEIWMGVLLWEESENLNVQVSRSSPVLLTRGE